MFLRLFLLSFLIFTFFLPEKSFSYTSPPFNVNISANVVNQSGGGSNTYGSKPINIETIINFSGKAYPLSKVYLFKDGNLIFVKSTDSFSNFYFSISGLKTNNYNFSIYAEDIKNRKSSSFSFPISITSGTTVNISNIFISPTIELDKYKTKQGNEIVISGKSIPNNEVIISFISSMGKEYFYKAKSSITGDYFYYLDTSIIPVDQYKIKSKYLLGSHSSPYSVSVIFSLLDKEIKKDEKFCSLLVGDLNCDGRVNLVDFSIMVFWYKKNNPPKIVDLNSDKKINLVDFSILVYNWTG